MWPYGRIYSVYTANRNEREMLLMLTSKQICTLEKAVTAHIWDFGILADINKFPKAMQGDNHLRKMVQIETRNIISGLNVSERKHFPDNSGPTWQRGSVTVHRCAQTSVHCTEAHTSCLYSTCLCVDLIITLLFVLLLCLSVCQAICVYISPSWQPACLPPTPHPPPPPAMLFTEMTPVWKFFTLFCAFPSLTVVFFLFMIRGALSQKEM